MNHSLKSVDIHGTLVSGITAIGAKAGYQRKTEHYIGLIIFFSSEKHIWGYIKDIFCICALKFMSPNFQVLCLL